MCLHTLKGIADILHVNSLHGGEGSIWRTEYAASLILGETETLWVRILLNML